MTWSRLTLLCAPPELTVWLEACMERFDLVPLLFSTSTSPGIIQPEGSLPADGELSRVVLLPRADAPAGTVPAGQVRSLERGWLEVRPGAHLQHPDGGVLLVSEFLAPTRPASPNTPVAWLRWLKRRVRADGVRVGVRGRDVRHGGESTYRDIRYSPGALRLLGSGVTWRPISHGNVIFEPLDPS
jgi:hypothetical protein